METSAACRALLILSSFKSRRSRRGKRAPRSEAPDRRSAKPAKPENNDPDAAIRRGKRHIRESVETILGALQEHAEEGSCSHAKFLFEFAGIEFGAEKSGKEDSLAEILLQRLDEVQREWREQESKSQPAEPPPGEPTSRKVE